MKLINQMLSLRKLIFRVRRPIYRLIFSVDIPASATVSSSARLKPSRGAPITIGDDTLVAFKTLVLTEDRTTGRKAAVKIGSRCIIGSGSLILPGVTIGDGSIVEAGSVVFEDVPSASIVAGNPARVIRSGIVVGNDGRRPFGDETVRSAKAARS